MATTTSTNNIMKSLLGSLLALHYVAALKCGRPLTTKCLGDTDIRYNKHASNSAKDQSVVWTKMEGWFRGVGSIRIGVEQSDGAVPTDGEAQSFRVVDFDQCHHQRVACVLPHLRVVADLRTTGTGAFLLLYNDTREGRRLVGPPWLLCG